jgi:hypothetical protein
MAMCSAQPSPFLRAAPEQDGALPGEGEPESSAEALGCDAGVLGVQMGERTGRRGGVWLINGRGGLSGLQGQSWCPGRALAGVGGGVAVLGPGVRGARILEGCGWTEAMRRTCSSSSHVDTQVFDSGGGIVMCEREGVAALVGCWGGVELACVNESDG